MSRIIDVTMGLATGMLNYPGNPEFQIEQYRFMAGGDTSNNSKFAMGCHVGTHVDAPAHYVDGAATIDQISPDVLVGPCRVIRLEQKAIDAKSLKRQNLAGVERLLVRTPSSDELSSSEFNTDFAHVTADGADYLLSLGVKLFGLDYLSLDRYKAPGHPAHHALLGAGVVVIEGVALSDVEAEDYEIICCPLKLVGAEAAPARVLLRTLD